LLLIGDPVGRFKHRRSGSPQASRSLEWLQPQEHSPKVGPLSSVAHRWPCYGHLRIAPVYGTSDFLISTPASAVLIWKGADRPKLSSEIR